MKNPILSTLLMLFIAVACNNNNAGSKEQSPVEQNAKVYYTCTMHPEVHADQPGKCPKCGMELVKEDENHTDTTQMHEHTDSMKHE